MLHIILLLHVFSTMMNVIDLTHTMHPGMPVYPGTESPEFLIPFTVEADGFTEKKITMFSHTGTHIDAPAHILVDGPTLDKLPATHFIGNACVLDFSKLQKPVIDLDDMTPFLRQIEKTEFVLMYTGWDRFWGQQAYFENYPVLSPEAAQQIASFNLKGIGSDMISVDPSDSRTLPIHQIFLGNNIVIIENLTNLEQLLQQEFTFYCLPLKIEQADGSPVRAVACIQ